MSADTATVKYTEDNMKSLKDAAHIRQNPGMYVGNTSASGLHHLVYEVVSNSVDEALAGYCKHIRLTLHTDGSISISDDGRGIPVGIKKDTGRSALEEALMVAGNSGKFDNKAYRMSIGLHGMGAKAVTALSEWTEAEVRRDGRVWKMEFEIVDPDGPHPIQVGPLQDLGPSPDGKTGTTITFKPDPLKFGDLKFSYQTLGERLREIAYLNRNLAITLVDENETPHRTESFQYAGGIAEYVAWLNENETPEHAPIYIHKEVDYPNDVDNLGLKVVVEVALQYTNGEEKIERCFTNGAFNHVGGTHLTGFRSGLTRAVSAYGKKENHFKEGLEPKGEDFREGLTAVICVGHPDPLFESQTKVKLNNPEVDGIVSSVVYAFMSEFLEKNPKEAAKICKRIALTAEARIAARKAIDALKDRKSLLNGGGLPGKLFDCTTRERDQSELFLVEGDSAGGSAESGRDRMFQAVLPLRGKVLNVEKAKLDKLLKNNEISALISATGVDIENVEDISKIRYGKIIILTDADVDGQHIRTLLLTFFFRQMRKLVEDGHLFVARPPLYKVTQKKDARFVQTREEMVQELMNRGLKETVLHIQAVNGRANRDVSGDDLTKLLPLLADIESAVVDLERRGYSLEALLKKKANDGLLPEYYVRVLLPRAEEHFFTRREELAALLEKWKQANGAEPVLGQDYTQDDWHEVRVLNRAIAKLMELGFEATDLIPLPRVAGREPPVRFVVEHGEVRRDLPHLQMLVAEIRKFGEKGISVTRFKGLGEMDPEELWATTLDPRHRTLLRVTLNDAMAAEKEFRRLMGEDVDGRRRFIFDKPLNNPEDIDYGA